MTAGVDLCQAFQEGRDFGGSRQAPPWFSLEAAFQEQVPTWIKTPD